MATIAQPMTGCRAAAAHFSVLWSWMTTVDHKKIGMLYRMTAMFFFLVGGIEALLIRLQLAQPNQHVFSADTYNAAVHDARHDDDLPRRHADAARRSSTSSSRS